MRNFWVCTACKLSNDVEHFTCQSCKIPRTLNNQHPNTKNLPPGTVVPISPGQSHKMWGPQKLTEGVKFDGDKPRTDLLDSDTLEEVARVLTFGAKKYEVNNWRKGIAASRLIGATLRHTFALMRGENRDPESGLHHAAHAICCLMFLFWTLQNKPEMDDRYKQETAT